jgi:hypothetical protein
VFTARYALSPYIKQICFVFKGLILCTDKSDNFLECYGIGKSYNFLNRLLYKVLSCQQIIMLTIFFC